MTKHHFAMVAIILSMFCGCTGNKLARSTKSETWGSGPYVEDSHVLVAREVHAPGLYPWTNGMRLTDAIASAGGFTDFATRSRVRIYHADGTTETHNYNLILKKKRQDPLLRPKDYVSVTSPIF